jgi:hypothetical protein
MNFTGQQGSFRLVVTTLVAALVWPGPWSAPAAPRELSDAEMDEVCAKGSTGFDVDLRTIHELVMSFTHHTAVAQVAGTILWRVEANTADPAQVQVLVGSQPLAPNTPLTLQAIQPIQIRAVNAAVRVTGDLNLSIKTSAAMTRTLARHQGILSRLGGLRH